MTKKYFLLCLFLLLISAVNSSYAQNNNYTITGTILDIRSVDPLFYVTVGLLNETDSTVVSVAYTDKAGVFSFSNIKTGNYMIKTSYIGYEIYEQLVSVAGESKEIKLEQILLQPIALNLSSVNIATTKPIYVNDGEKILYNVSEDPSVQTGTAADALQNAPGVEVDIEGNITLRGVSSVEIWINGKKSRMEAENLKTYIQQLPANALERIEVINNPSARYGASGGGIINIVTNSNIKKNSFLSFGINGSTKPFVSPWISYMYANEKFSINLYLNSNYNFSKGKTEGFNIILNEEMDTSSYKNYAIEWRDNSIWASVYLDGSYDFDSLKTLSFWGYYGGMFWGKWHSYSDYQYQEFINNPGIYNYLEESNNKGFRHGAHLGVDYEHNFNEDGHKLLTEIWGGYWKPKSDRSFIRMYEFYPELNKNKIITYDDYNYNFGAEMHYSLPYHKNGLIEMGIEGYYYREIMNRRTDTLFTNIYMLDSMRYENSVFQGGDLDAYITIQHKFGGFTIKGGLRNENRFLKYRYLNMPEHHGINNFAGLFPSLHLSYATKNMHNFNLSYTRNVRYPRNSRLSTFIIYDEDSYSTGNPNLKSTYTNSIEGGWTKYFDKFGSVGISAYFKNNKNEMNDLTDVIYSDFYGRYVSFKMPVNSGKSHRYGTEVNVMYKLKAFMNIRFNASIYQSHSETKFRDEEKPVMTDFLGYSFKLNFWAKLWKFLEINASGNYRSKTKTIFFEDLPYYSINCGLRADFWNRKISVFLNVQDIFNWGRERTQNTNPYYIEYNSRKWNSRFIIAGITFRFGKMEMESKARTGGNTE
jgi:outer membrane receptor protein involved in Fe transport